jgi:hypothetical protein
VWFVVYTIFCPYLVVKAKLLNGIICLFNKAPFHAMLFKPDRGVFAGFSGYSRTLALVQKGGGRGSNGKAKEN